ncbi:hypothetical protein HPB47_013778, partial [Ixodes persulcatus]
MGVRSIFSDVDLSRVTGDGGLRVTDVQHKANIEVNEEGTVAAAATVVIARRRRPHFFAVDRPFLFYIREKATGRVLFLGEVHELPAAKPTLEPSVSSENSPARDHVTMCWRSAINMRKEESANLLVRVRPSPSGSAPVLLRLLEA